MSKLVKGAGKLGMTEDTIYQSLGAAGINNDDIEHLLEGIVPRWEMNPGFLGRVTKRAVVSAPSQDKKMDIEMEIERRKMLIEQYVEEEYGMFR
ncbi:unnamed protein product [marine sediment metagenome]|uniref:Uncharacterized protein n=1 Tax=marine sediment metagenome TaxID=412755 RepID=X1BIM0_9ZZZZ